MSKSYSARILIVTPWNGIYMNFIRILLWVLPFYFFLPQELPAKIRLLTFHYNHVEFLEFQCKTFKSFILDDYEVIVVNDAPNADDEKLIRETCEKNGLKCVRFEQSWHMTDPLNEYIRMRVDTPQKNSYFHFPLVEGYPDLEAISQQCSVRHCHVIQHALDLFGYDHDDIVVIMDGDVFPIKPISIRDLLIDAPLAGVDSGFHQRHYLWVPFIAFDPTRLPNIKDLKFHLDVIDDLLCDTGSHSYLYLKNNPEVPYRFYPRCFDTDFYPWDPSTFLKFGFDDPRMAQITWPTTMEFYVDYHFVHYVGGSSSLGGPTDLYPKIKRQALYDLLKCVLKEY